MTSQILGPRKQRTREHIIADLSVHHVMGFILEEGHTAQQLGSDYGYDLILWTFDKKGYPMPGSIYFQFKAREKLLKRGTDWVYDLDVRDYNLWMWEKTPVVLVLFDATRGRAFWVCIQRYFHGDLARQPKKGRKLSGCAYQSIKW
jgi:hypothetical protein